jgi:ATP-binding cassette subfamily B protein
LPRLLRDAMRLTWQANRAGFVVAAVLQVVGAVVVSVFVLVGKSVLENLLALGHGGGSARHLIPVVILLVVITAGGAAAATLQQQQQRLVSEDLANVVWDRVLDVTARVGLEYYESPRFHDQLLRIRTNAMSQPGAVTGTVFGLLGTTVGVGCLLVVLLTIEPLLVPVLLLAGVPALLLGKYTSGIEFRFIARTMPIFRSRDYLRGVLVGREEAKEVRAFGAERALRSRCTARSREYRTELRGHVRLRQRYALAAIAVNAGALGATLGMLIWFLAIGRISLAGAAAAAVGVRMLSSGLNGIYRSINGLFQSAVFLADLEAFLGLAAVAEGQGSGIRPAFRHEITVDSVSYTYPGSREPAVHAASLCVRPGEVVALVGENGSGKTTLAKLLAGLYQPAGGRIEWDGVDLAGLEPADVRRAVSVIFQDFVRYELSALENIGLGDPDHADDEIAARAAAIRAGADGFVAELSAGYRTSTRTARTCRWASGSGWR